MLFSIDFLSSYSIFLSFEGGIGGGSIIGSFLVLINLYDGYSLFSSLFLQYSIKEFQFLSFDKVLEFPITNKQCLALVIATFILR